MHALLRGTAAAAAAPAAIMAQPPLIYKHSVHAAPLQLPWICAPLASERVAYFKDTHRIWLIFYKQCPYS